MNKMRMESVDLTAQNIEKIGTLFPNCITETADENGNPKKAINFELLKQMLSGDVIEGEEAYEFTWVGKKAAIVEANKPIRKTLRPCQEESVDWDNTENLYIEGDNLQHHPARRGMELQYGCRPAHIRARLEGRKRHKRRQGIHHSGRRRHMPGVHNHV